MLPRGEHVLDVFTNPSTGLLSIPQGGNQKFFLECSTIETSTSVDVGKKVAKSGLGEFVDSPVSGGPQGSDAGTLTFMIGGPTELYEKAKPILSMMGKRENIFHCGKEGAGLATKQINNYCAWVSFLGLCEGE
jgi:3-hydroxyisobutyrate dehydrogenase